MKTIEHDAAARRARWFAGRDVPGCGGERNHSLTSAARMGEGKRPFARLVVLAALAVVVLSGCGTARTTDPARTGSEQFLMTRAAQDAIDPLDLKPFEGRRVFVERPRLDGGTADDRAYMTGQLRARLLEAGAHVVPTIEEAEVVLELRSGSLGIDRNQLFIGAPANTATILVRVFTALPADISHPPIDVVKADRQWGGANAALVAYWQDTGDVYGLSGPIVGRSVLERWNVILLGRRTISNVPTTIDPLDADTEDLFGGGAGQPGGEEAADEER